MNAVSWWEWALVGIGLSVLGLIIHCMTVVSARAQQKADEELARLEYQRFQQRQNRDGAA